MPDHPLLCARYQMACASGAEFWMLRHTREVQIHLLLHRPSRSVHVCHRMRKADSGVAFYRWVLTPDFSPEVPDVVSRLVLALLMPENSKANVAL